mmetsp:Transcript_87127/g.154204  ORF Transcript_87127/g.154204 Transcript_87127/m.154204 type:complete len:726 (+) Transcript_87127:54-2231(+)
MHGGDFGTTTEEPESCVILKVTVELPADQSATILVREGDNARSLAAKFCEEHKLEFALVEPLAVHITENLVRNGVAEIDGKVTAAKPLHQRRTARNAQTPPRVQAHNHPRRGPVISQRQSTQCQGQRTPRQSEIGSAHRDPCTPRFMQLHQDAMQKKIRMQRLQQQVERDEDQRSRSSIQVAPGTMRYAAWHRRSEDCALGDRLFRDAAQRQLKIRHLQAQQEEERRLQEDLEATFKPSIEVSQRSCQGTPRSLQDPEGLKRRMKIERLKNMQEKAEMDGCTFKPEIDQKSEELIHHRLARMKISGTLYDSLYEDALRRKERQIESTQILPPGVTFRPDIGVDHHRQPNDDTREDFVNRLAYSKSYSERWISLKRQAQDEERQCQDSRLQPEFHPQTGRGPHERNKRGLPIGDFLYETGREKAWASQAQLDIQKERSQPSTPRMGELSRQMFEETKQRKYRLLFDALVSADQQGQLRASSVCLDGIDDELAEFLQPMVAYLQETEKTLEFGAFCAALDYQRQHAAAPTAHLFVERRRLRLPKGPDAAVPKIDANSSRIASRRRARSVPLHEQLFRERDVRDARLEEKRLLAEEQQLQECTFKPNVTGASSPTRSRSAHSLGSRSGVAISLAPSSPMRTPRKDAVDLGSSTPCSLDLARLDSARHTPTTPRGYGGPSPLWPGGPQRQHATSVPQLPARTQEACNSGDSWSRSPERFEIDQLVEQVR